MTFFIKRIDDFLNTTTMYQLLLNSLFILTSISILFGFFGIIAYSGLSLIGSFIVLTVVCYTTNYIIGRLVGAYLNFESSSITALILFFILAPGTDLYSFGILALAGLIAMASKYVLAIHKKHIFNPAAISVFILSLFGVGSAIWWVATLPLLLIVCVIGFLILRKVDKFKVFFSFALVAILTILGFALYSGASVSDVFPLIFTSWPIVFFGAIMLTEPATTPPKNSQQTIYAVLVGLLFGAQFHIGPIFSTPECALVLGNIYTYLVSPKYFSKLVLQQKNQLASHIYEFVFSGPKKLANTPGQYLQWTLPHPKPDNRGTRRYFTVASSPSEEGVKIGMRMAVEKSSSFKKYLLSMKAGDTIVATGLAGDFILPKDPKEKLVFIAGGIGITPFRSMISYLIDRGQHRDITLLYSSKTMEDIAYKDIFKKAEEIVGLKTWYVIDGDDQNISTMPNVLRAIDAATITSHILDYKERIFYLSGPRAMVTAYEKLLKSLGVKTNSIKTDFFPGF